MYLVISPVFSQMYRYIYTSGHQIEMYGGV